MRQNNLEINDFKDSTLLMPSFNSVANIGSLTLDLLVSSLDFKLIGSLVSQYQLQMTAQFNNQFLSSLDIYSSPSFPNLTILISRADVLKDHGILFTKDLADWLNPIFKNVVIVGGIDATRRSDLELAGPLGLMFEKKDFNDIPVGAGLTKLFLQECTLDVKVLCWWANPGDNLEFVKNCYYSLLEFLKIKEIEALVPKSWSKLYGETEAPSYLY